MAWHDHRVCGGNLVGAWNISSCQEGGSNLNKFARDYYENEALSLKDHQQEMYFGHSWNRYWHETRLLQILKMIRNLKFKTSLDVGCAEGYYIKLMAISQDSAELHLIGLDVSKNYLVKAKKEVPNASWVQGDVDNLPFRRSSIDLVLCSEVLEHVPNPKSAFNQLVQTSRKYVLLSVAGENLFHYFVSKLGLWKPRSPFVKDKCGHIHEMAISEVSHYWTQKQECKHLQSIVTCYFPVSFMKSRRIPVFSISILKFVDKLISMIPVAREFGAVQIALFRKSRTLVQPVINS